MCTHISNYRNSSIRLKLAYNSLISTLYLQTTTLAMSSERERKYDPRGSPERQRSRSPPASYRQPDPMKDDPSVIKIRGLPYQTTAMEVCRFFKDCEIVGGPNGIYFPLNERGLPTGEAFVEMETARDIDKALERHKDCIGER